MSLGEFYYNHFEQFFKTAPAARSVYDFEDGMRESIQVLRYDGVYENAAVFCTLGLSHFDDELSETAEVTLVVDNGFIESVDFLVDAISHLVDHKIAIREGVAVRGVHHAYPSFFQRFAKEALYFTDCSGFPPGLDFVKDVSTGQTMGKVFWAFFISSEEHEYYLKYGAQKLEELLLDTGIDPFDVDRVSCC